MGNNGKFSAVAATNGVMKIYSGNRATRGFAGCDKVRSKKLSFAPHHEKHLSFFAFEITAQSIWAKVWLRLRLARS